MSATATSARLPAHAGPLQRLIAPLVDPSVFDFWAQLVNPAWSWSRPLAQVVERRVEAEDSVTLVLKPNRHCGKVQPGQHVNVSAEVNGRRVTRSYSITNVPARDGLIEITVKRTEGGRLSTHLCREAREGDVVELGSAFGDMTLPAQPAGKWLFLAAGSGITPLISLTRQLAQRGMPVPVTLIYWAKRRVELCFLNELRQLAARHPQFQLCVVLTHEAALLAGEHKGFISAEQLAELVPDLGERQVYACGPGGFVDTARTLCSGVAKSFLAEGFTPAASTVPAAEVAAATSTVRVQLMKSGRALDLPTGESLLAALEAQGLNPPSGCRMGVCHTCVCTKHSGTVQDLLTRTTDPEPGTQVRLCVSRPCSDITLDL